MTMVGAESSKVQCLRVPTVLPWHSWNMFAMLCIFTCSDPWDARRGGRPALAVEKVSSKLSPPRNLSYCPRRGALSG